MTLKAKPVLKDKFWIVENDSNERIGTMAWNDDRYLFSSGIETCFFDNKPDNLDNADLIFLRERSSF